MNAWSLTAVVAVAITGIINLTHTARRLPPPPRAPEIAQGNPVVRHEQRLGAVARALRRHGAHGTLGYLADLPTAQLSGDASAMEDYFLTQFVLVPWVIDAGSSDCTWALANLRHATAATRVPADFSIVEDFGQGVLLLRRTRP